jgi:hypothetical protein
MLARCAQPTAATFVAPPTNAHTSFTSRRSANRPPDPENGSHCDLAGLAVYDAHDRVCSILKRDDEHYAYTRSGKLIGVFRSRVEAAPSIPAKGST